MATQLSQQDQEQIQALVGSGFGTLQHCEYVLLDIVSAAPARAWLGRAWPGVWSIAKLGREKHNDREAWSIAFTHRGLAHLGIVEDREAPFPSEFRAGQADEIRRKLLCEDPSVTWAWGDVPAARWPETKAVSLLVVRAHDGSAPVHPLLQKGELEAHGLRLVRRVHADPGSVQTAPGDGKPIRYVVEPFGFRDGMGQPKVQGLQFFRTQGDELEKQAHVPLGEFVLGHANAYGEASHCPEVKAGPNVPADASFARNGSYLAVQQILQDVAAFERFEAANPATGKEASLVEKMIGRRKDGRPLQVTPKELGPDDDFGFRTNDPHGFQCPIGSHVRRANPRDSLEAEAGDRPKPAHLHRLLRRSRPFACTGAPDDSGPPAGAAREVGMFFIAVVADLSRQFEFVKRAWIGNPRFGNLSGEVDPLLGRAAGRCFTTPGQPLGSRVHALPNLTQTQGGGYFFLPSLTTLQRIADGDYSPGSEA
ncbi:MAG: Dyp-type peroxidase [Ramlibacter sp.]